MTFYEFITGPGGAMLIIYAIVAFIWVGVGLNIFYTAGRKSFDAQMVFAGLVWPVFLVILLVFLFIRGLYRLIRSAINEDWEK